MKLINILGSNATGKSTRVFKLIQYLDSEYSSEDFFYNTRRKGKICIGKLYVEIGFFILGRFTKDKNKWVSLDTADLSSYEDKFEFYKYIIKNNPEIKTILQEGYFNNRSAQGSPNNLRNIGIKSSTMYFLYYDNVEQFLERTNNRSGKQTRGLDWAESSPGWRDNKTVQETEKNYIQNSSELDKIERVDINAPETYFIKELFGVDIRNSDEIFNNKQYQNSVYDLF